jgi:multidrug efflux pump subunit AcrA (membrane-fusion protein)
MEKNYTNQLENISHHKVSALGIGLIILIFGIFGAWAVFAKMDLTIKAPGQIIVESHPKVIKHPKGGVV